MNCLNRSKQNFHELPSMSFYSDISFVFALHLSPLCCHESIWSLRKTQRSSLWMTGSKGTGRSPPGRWCPAASSRRSSTNGACRTVVEWWAASWGVWRQVVGLMFPRWIGWMAWIVHAFCPFKSLRKKWMKASFGGINSHFRNKHPFSFHPRRSQSGSKLGTVNIQG